MSDRKVILYIASSLDGYIAAPGDDLSFLERVHKEGQDYGYNDFLASVDTIIMGRKTYDWIMQRVETFPHPDKRTYVITRSERPPEGNILFYSGSLKELVEGMRNKRGQHIFCDGGAGIVHALLHERLIDEIILSVVPVLLGKGVRLFREGQPSQDLKLIDSRNFSTGLVQLHYQVY